MKKIFTIELGAEVRDKVTGFTGIVTARVEYLVAHNQIQVEAPSNNDTAGVALWISEARLEVTGVGLTNDPINKNFKKKK